MDIIKQSKRQNEQKFNGTQTSKGPVTATGIKGQLHFGSRQKRAILVMVILQSGAAIDGTLIKGINALVDAKRARLFNNALKMVAVNVELTHLKLLCQL